MNSWFIILVLLSTFSLPGHAQLLSTEYFDDMWKEANEHKYEIRREVIQSDSGYVYIDYQKNGRLIFRGEYASINPDVPHGHFKFYFENRKLEAEGNYKNGDMVGKWIFYDQKGLERLKVDYDLPGTLCMASDSSINFMPLLSPEESGLEQIPRFPGGDNAFYTFLYERIVYPPLAKMYYKSGTAIGIFTIDKSGEVCDVRVEGEVDRDIKKETLRVLRLLPKWEPGKIGDRPVRVKYTCPVIFKFQ